jgi:hypothetical protein
MRTSVVLLRESVWPTSVALTSAVLLAGLGGLALGRHAIGPPLVQLRREIDGEHVALQALDRHRRQHRRRAHRRAPDTTGAVAHLRPRRS